MELRRHPSIRHRGTSADFGGSYRPSDRFPQGEQGELVGVEYREDVPGSPPHVWISIRYEGRILGGPVVLDDVALLRFLGRPILEAGAMDLDAALGALRAKITQKLRDGTLPELSP